MKTIIMLVTLFSLSLFSTGAFAQSLDDRLKTLEETIQKQEQGQKTLQETLRKQGETIDEQRKIIEQLKAEVAQTKQPAAAKTAVSGETTPPEEMKQQVQELKDEVDRVAEAQRKVLPSEFNPGIGRPVRFGLCGGQRIGRPGYRRSRSGDRGSRAADGNPAVESESEGGPVLRRIRAAGLHPRS